MEDRGQTDRVTILAIISTLTTDLLPDHFSIFKLWAITYRVGQKAGLMSIILSNLKRFTFFSRDDSLVNLQLNGYLKSHRTLQSLLHYLVKH